MATTPTNEKGVKKGKSRVQLTEGTARWLRMRAEFEDKDVDQLVRQMIQERNLLKPMNLQPGVRFEPDVRTALYSTLAFIVTLDLIVTFYSGLVIPITLGVVLILRYLFFIYSPGRDFLQGFREIWKKCCLQGHPSCCNTHTIDAHNTFLRRVPSPELTLCSSHARWNGSFIVFLLHIKPFTTFSESRSHILLSASRDNT